MEHKTHVYDGPGAPGDRPSPPSTEDLLDAARRCLPTGTAPYDVVEISAGLLQWLIDQASELHEEYK